jgi:hypothetical protein
MEDIIISFGNTTQKNLKYNESFKGIPEMSGEFLAIQIFFKASEKCNVIVEQGNKRGKEFVPANSQRMAVKATRILTHLSHLTHPFFRIVVTNDSLMGKSTDFLKLITRKINKLNEDRFIDVVASLPLFSR